MTDPKHKQSDSLREPRPKKKLGLTVPQPLRMPHEELVWRMKMTRAELVETVNQDAENRIREGVKAVIEQILEEEMTAHIGAARRERSPLRRDERNGLRKEAASNPHRVNEWLDGGSIRDLGR